MCYYVHYKSLAARVALLEISLSPIRVLYYQYVQQLDTATAVQQCYSLIQQQQYSSLTGVRSITGGPGALVPTLPAHLPTSPILP